MDFNDGMELKLVPDKVVRLLSIAIWHAHLSERVIG